MGNLLSPWKGADAPKYKGDVTAIGYINNGKQLTIETHENSDGQSVFWLVRQVELNPHKLISSESFGNHESAKFTFNHLKKAYI